MADRTVIYQLYEPSHRGNLISSFQYAKPLRCLQSEGEIDIGSEEGLADHAFEESTDFGHFESQVVTPGISGLSCSTCDVYFSNVLEQRQHFKLDWHRHNMKRKEHFQKPIDEAEFAEIMDGLSSISGSDSEDEDSVDNKLASLIEKAALNKESSIESDNVLNTQQSPTRVPRSPKVFFENDRDEVIAIYQTMLPPLLPQGLQTIGEEDVEQVLSYIHGESLASSRMVGVVMLSGGHFAAAVFKGTKELLHKTIHRYTVRAKQGGSQGRCDNKSGGSGPKSAGAGLRRYNEQTLTQEIQSLLKSWEDEFRQCQWIFYRVGGSSQRIIFGTKSAIFAKGNTKLRKIPFPTKRPTFSEVKKVVSELTSIQIYQKEDFMKKFLPKPTADEPVMKSPEKVKKKRFIDRTRSRSPKTKERPSLPVSPDEASDSELDVEFTLEVVPTELDLRDELQEFDDSLASPERARKVASRRRKPRSKNSEKVKTEPWGLVAEILNGVNRPHDGESVALASLHNITEQKSENMDEFLQALLTDLNQRLDEENTTILHLTVKKNFLDLTWELLECGSDPALKDKSGKYPYNWSPSKECRNLFRRFRGKFPEKYDYQKAQIPGPLTDEMEQEIAEKKKVQNKLKREKEKQKKMERKEKDEEVEEQKRFLSLTDREKQALAAERRLLGQCKRNGEAIPVLLRCFDCASDITGKVPFEYNQNMFCSSKCLACHRKKFPAPLSF